MNNICLKRKSDISRNTILFNIVAAEYAGVHHGQANLVSDVAANANRAGTPFFVGLIAWDTVGDALRNGHW